MQPLLGWKHACCVTATLIFASRATAEVRKLREIDLSPKQDRGIVFATGITPSGDLLSFVAKNSGTWQLYRVHNWHTASASTEVLSVSGFFSKAETQDAEGRRVEMLNAQVFATADGAYAVCVANPFWVKRALGRAEGRSRSDNIIAIVDLSTFTVVGKTHTEGLDLFEVHSSVQLDHDGFLLLDSLSGDKRGAFIRLAVPSLKPSPVCVYKWVPGEPKPKVPGEFTVPAGQHPELQTPEACRAALGSTPFSDYSLLIQSTFKFPSPGCDSDNRNHAEFCRWPGSFTSDGKFGIAYAHDGHDSLLGNYVETNARYVLFSSAKRSDMGEVKVSTRDSVQVATAALDGRDFLITISNGTHLIIYELRD